MQASRLFIDKIPAIKYLPNTAAGKLIPAVIMLHGISETGDGTDKGLDKLANSGNHANLLKAGDTNEFMVVAPQFVPALNEYVPEWTGGKYVDKVIEWVKANLPVDVNRIYLTGLSGGGGGTWNYFTTQLAYANKIAAAVPICGLEQVNGDFSIPAKSNLPIWAFHAIDDKTVNVGSSRRQIEQVNKYNPVPAAKYTEYATGGHSIWGRVYGDPALYIWMLSQSRSTVPEPVKKTVQSVDLVGNRVLLSDGLYYPYKALDIDISPRQLRLHTTFEAGDDTFTIPL